MAGSIIDRRLWHLEDRLPPDGAIGKYFTLSTILKAWNDAGERTRDRLSVDTPTSSATRSTSCGSHG